MNRTRRYRPDEFNGVVVPYDDSVEALIRRVEGRVVTWPADLLALSHCKAPEAERALVRFASSPDNLIRRASLEYLGRRERPRRHADLFLRGLEDSCNWVVRAAIVACVEAGLATARPRILKLMESEDSSVAIAALTALRRIGQPEDFAAVKRIFVGAKSEETRREAAWTLRRLAGPSTSDEFVQLLVADPVPRHRVWACELAGEYPREDQLKIISPLLNDPDGHVRKAAVTRSSR